MTRRGLVTAAIAVVVGTAGLAAQTMPGGAMAGQSGKMGQGQMGQMDRKDQMPKTGMMPMAGMTPKVGETAPDFTLHSIAGGTVSLADALKDGPVVLLMMRGWPGYQCPFCTRQFGDYLRNADALKTAGARVIFVYPGPAEGLEMHAKEFTKDQTMPSNFAFLVDPDYTFTNLYGLRWDAPNETSYPTTFVLDRTGKVTFVVTSHEHGGRVPAADVLKQLSMIKGMGMGGGARR
ncbi:MAG: peroxiredoxin family protein [Vicinamibacterales bacterium]